MSHYVVPADLNPFWFYQSSFDPVTVMKRYAVPNLQPTPGMFTNYLGVKIDPKFFPPLLSSLAGQVEGMPWPSNWHADIAEWGAALRAVDLSGETFTAVELGCGWGCWLNITGAAARFTGRKVKLIGVEGDEGHANWAVESLTTNGFAGQFDIIRGIAGATPGKALFPRQDHAGGSWGLEAIFNATPEQVAKAEKQKTHDVLDIFTFEHIAAKHGTIDLLHIDIQGAEADLIESCLPALAKYVRFILIGTHSRENEGRIEKVMLGDGWLMEMDRPAILSLENSKQTLRVDGVQGWRNPRLAPL